jgi:hypothetical protein
LIYPGAAVTVAGGDALSIVSANVLPSASVTFTLSQGQFTGNLNSNGYVLTIANTVPLTGALLIDYSNRSVLG